MDDKIDFAKRTCISSIDLSANSHNLSTDYEIRIIAIGTDCQNIISIEQLTDSLLEIKENLYIDLRVALQLEKEENEAMINAEIEASMSSKRSKAIKLRAEVIKAKANQQSDGLSIGAQTSKSAEMKAPLAVPEDIVSKDLEIGKIVIRDEFEETDASDKKDKSKSLKRNQTGNKI